MNDLVPLPPPPEGVGFPTTEWEPASPGSIDQALTARIAEPAFSDNPGDAFGETLALLAVHRGRIAFERYGDGHGPDETYRSWSMAKSITHAIVGMLIEDGKLALDDPAPVPAWAAADDPRHAITLHDLLCMADGLDFVEDYVDGEGSDVIRMLFLEGKDDVAAYAESKPLAHPPGTFWNYSSGTTNIVAALAGRAIGGPDGMRAYMQGRLFGPIGMQSASPRFDPAGTFIGSSFCFCTARDFARFGLLYLRDGVWDRKRVLPAGWVDHARRTTPASEGEYGAHWWLWLVSESSFHCSGYEGQYVVCVPERDLVVVRLGVSTPEQRERIRGWLTEFVEAFPRVDG